MRREHPLSAPYVAQFTKARATLPGHALPWLSGLRDKAIERFSSLDFPTPKVEEWKFTNLAPLTKTVFGPGPAKADEDAGDAVQGFLMEETPCHLLVFVDGRYRPRLSALGDLPAGAEVTTLAAALKARPDMLESHLGGGTAIGEKPFVALNTAFMADGAVLNLEPGVALERPVHFLYMASAHEAPVVTHPRTLVLAGRGSAATVLESYIGAGSQTYWTNAVTDVVVDEGAALKHYRLQAEGAKAFHIATTEVRLARDSRYESFVLAVGGRLARNEIAAALNGTNIDCRLSGAYLARDRQHIDNTTLIDHAQPESHSREVYKGVLDGKAHAVFQGKIVVRPQAQKTDAHQLNKNLLLSETARVDTKPELEIHADDVKCSHGASVGELDAEALFYMRARGIDARHARNLLIEAFVGETFEHISFPPVRAHLERMASSWLPSRHQGGAP